MAVSTKKRVIVIVGPTASGKTSLSVRLAKKFGGEVISADSRQIYKGLNIGTGKVTKKEMAGVPHYMLDVANPKKRFTVAQFAELARKNLEEIFSRGKLPIVVGGTGFYISALIDGITFPEVPPNEKLRLALNKRSPERLYEQLAKLDSERAKAIDRYNKRRLIRAIEIAKALGKVPKIESESRYETLWIGLKPDGKSLRQKIHIRLFERIRGGMVAEANNLHRVGLSWKRMEELGLEYKYLAFYLKGKLSKEQMLKELETAIWHYARRQMTWFKRDKRIAWFDATSKNLSKDVLSKANAFRRSAPQEARFVTPPGLSKRD